MSCGGRLVVCQLTRVYDGPTRVVADDVMCAIKRGLTKLVSARCLTPFLAGLFCWLLGTALAGSRSPDFLSVLGRHRGYSVTMLG